MASLELSPASSDPRGADSVFPEIPGYRIEETLGRGSTGVVFRATQLAVDKQVAIKVLHPELCGRVKAVLRLQREARTTAKLSHPGIVSAVDMGQAGGQWWYAMEFVEGESLADRIKRVGRLSERETVRLFAPLCDALQHASENGVVHRDIKPANILIDRFSRARLVDLGLAFAEDEQDLTATGGTLGTPHYISPEQARAPKSADVRSDIWSLGATMYHAACGRPPFDGRSLAEILSGVLYGRVADPREFAPKLSRDMALVLRKCLSRDPQRRYQTPQELSEDLECLRERRHVAVRARTLEPSAQIKRRSPAAWAALGLLGVSLLGLGGWWWRSHAAGKQASLQQGPKDWPELEQIATLALGDDVVIAAALTALSELGPAPEAHQERANQVSTLLRGRWREAQARFRQRFLADWERAREQRDFAAAAALVGDDFAARAQRELNPSPAQLRELENGLRREELSLRIERELAQAVTHFQSQLEELYVHIVPERIAALKQQGRWRKAKAELLRPPMDLAVELGWSVPSLPAGAVQELFAKARFAAELDADRLDVEWRALDQDLAQWTEERALEIRSRLESRTQARPAAEELLASVAARRASLGLSAEESLDEVSSAARLALEAAERSLEELEQGLLGGDAREWLQAEQERNQELLRRRDYDSARSIWEHASKQAWLAAVRDQIDRNRVEAELLQGLLEQAAGRVREQDGLVASVLVGSVPVEGVIECGLDPLRDGFRLVPKQGAPYALVFRPRADGKATLVSTEMIERFAGLDLRDSTPRQQLLRALLRWSDGQAAGAVELLPLPPQPEELQAVAADLGGRLRQLESSVQRKQVERAQRAAGLLHVVQRAAREPASDRAQVVRSIDELLTNFGDLASVQTAAADLRRLRERLLAPAAPRSVEEIVSELGARRGVLEDERVTLEYEFGTQELRAWSSGIWTREPTGWSANGSAFVSQLVDESRWPTIDLPAWVDLSQALAVDFWIEQPAESGPPRGLALSVAGWHFVLATQTEGSRGRWQLASGSSADLARIARETFEESKGQTGPGLSRRTTHHVRLELSHARGRGVLYLDGKLVGRADLPRPDGKARSASISLRSLEPVRLLRAQMEMGLR